MGGGVAGREGVSEEGGGGDGGGLGERGDDGVAKALGGGEGEGGRCAAEVVVEERVGAEAEE